MADPTPAEPTQEQKDAGFVLNTIAGAVSTSLDAMAQRNEVANAALMGLTVILASMPESVSFYERIGMPRMPDTFCYRREV